mmetsp:Transcript_32985/g.77097  ORF Transcript_32985/g.77097 Transcript_32985/m.77097 type:complete len:216 (+) Transcript_32985:481-1128(+)
MRGRTASCSSSIAQTTTGSGAPSASPPCTSPTRTVRLRGRCLRGGRRRRPVERLSPTPSGPRSSPTITTRSTSHPRAYPTPPATPQGCPVQGTRPATPPPHPRAPPPRQPPPAPPPRHPRTRPGPCPPTSRPASRSSRGRPTSGRASRQPPGPPMGCASCQSGSKRRQTGASRTSWTGCPGSTPACRWARRRRAGSGPGGRGWSGPWRPWRRRSG